jgi:tetrahydromethanopterin S-methyltransferase subunit F
MKTATSAIPSRPSRLTSEDLVSAMITGQIAGLIMAVVVMLVFTLFLDGVEPLRATEREPRA